MSLLPPSFLGKKVYLDSTNKRYYVVKYEEHIGKKKTNVLLFDQDSPVIFAVLHDDGHFLDSFYLTNKTTKESARVLEEYKKISDRKKQHRVTQEDLKDALKPIEEAKMKNENIIKHLVDEHLEDIKHLWPSRLLTLQKTEGKSEQSLILSALDQALEKANASKSFQFLTNHRYDSHIPILGMHINQYPQLLDDVTNYYLSHNELEIARQFLNEAVKNISLHEQELLEQLLNTAKRIDHIYYTKTLRLILSKLFKRVKEEKGVSPKAWLRETINDKSLKRSIVDSVKKKIG
ncbi:hypothetical protein [Evansella cellulosilytica]|uniref:Uncharacterized protein n=1 Tax=Evansella cellulosilytica (strain ATCC 21833 / DSM 2522 / FERM P-1141 / JCM 9156 / N-4) TaxID=649639 RepID=E6U1Y6_EVAC2|nr:hypothetical protein [Evansella cellulosilytica]ADU29230.1 hypothetical protein Bcell_0957 [Evansella cellulosilytica DSM 2522]